MNDFIETIVSRFAVFNFYLLIILLTIELAIVELIDIYVRSIAFTTVAALIIINEFPKQITFLVLGLNLRLRVCQCLVSDKVFIVSDFRTKLMFNVDFFPVDVNCPAEFCFSNMDLGQALLNGKFQILVLFSASLQYRFENGTVLLSRAGIIPIYLTIDNFGVIITTKSIFVQLPLLST